MILTINNGLSDGDGEGVTVSGITASGSGLTMASPASRTFTNGVLTIATIQAPSAAGLSESPCHDRGNFSTATGTNGPRTSFRGVVTGNFGGSLYYLMDPLAKGGNGQRTGISVFGPSQPLLYGHRYLISGNIQEFDGINTQTPAGETEAVSVVYIQDEGLDASINVIEKPELVINNLCDFVTGTSGATCDVSQTVTNAEDYEGTLVRIKYVKSSRSVRPVRASSSRVRIRATRARCWSAIRTTRSPSIRTRRTPSRSRESSPKRARARSATVSSRAAMRTSSITDSTSASRRRRSRTR